MVRRPNAAGDTMSQERRTFINPYDGGIQVIASSSKGNCYYIDDKDSPLLLDCGISASKIQAAINFTLAKVAGCLITHEHQDHAKAVKELVSLGVDCYMSEGTFTALGLKPSHRIKIAAAKRQCNVSGWNILPFDLQHDAAEPLGFLMVKDDRKILYITDTYYCKYTFTGVTHLLVECNYAKDILYDQVEQGLVHEAQKNRLLRSHFELSNVKKFLKSNDLSQTKAIYLIHLSNKNGDAERFKKEIQAATGKPVYIA